MKVKGLIDEEVLGNGNNQDGYAPLSFLKMKSAVSLVVFLVLIIAFVSGLGRGRGPELETPIVIP